jgi:hypothetical protein
MGGGVITRPYVLPHSLSEIYLYVFIKNLVWYVSRYARPFRQASTASVGVCPLLWTRLHSTNYLDIDYITYKCRFEAISNMASLAEISNSSLALDAVTKVEKLILQLTESSYDSTLEAVKFATSLKFGVFSPKNIICYSHRPDHNVGRFLKFSL